MTATPDLTTIPPIGTDARAMLDALYLLERRALDTLTGASPMADFALVEGIRQAIACARIAYEDHQRLVDADRATVTRGA